MNDSDPSLSALRTQIDEIDTQLVAALKRRWDVLAMIGATKNRTQQNAVDLGREAEIRERWRSTAEQLQLPSARTLRTPGAA